jgi:O-antigen/teichoic acid export membrane protein
MPPGTLASRAARGSVWLAGSAWLTKGLQTVVILASARALEPSDLGLLSVAALTVNVVVLQGLGLAAALTYRPDRVAEAARTALTLMLVAAVIASAALWFGAPAIAGFLQDDHATTLLRGFTLVITGSMAAGVPMALLDRNLDFRGRFLPEVVPALIGATLSIALLLAGVGVVGVLLGQIAQSVLTPLLLWLVGVRVLPGWDGVLAVELLRYGWKTTAAALLQIAVLNVDYILIARLLGPTPLGLYSLAFRICYVPYITLTYVINGVAFPYYCRLPSRIAIGRALSQVTGVLSVLTVPLFTLIVLFAGSVVALGDRWGPAALSLQLLAVYGMLLSIADTALDALKAAGRPALVVMARFAQLVGLASLILLTVSHGIAVVAFDQVVMAAALMVVSVMWAKRVAGVSISGLVRSILPAVSGAAVMVAVVLVLRRVSVVSDPHDVVAVVVPAAVGIAAYAAVVFGLAHRSLRHWWNQMRMGSSETPATQGGGVVCDVAADPTRSHSTVSRDAPAAGVRTVTS